MLGAKRREIAGAAIAVAGFAALAIVGPYLTKDPIAGDLDRGVSELGAPLPPSGHAWLGTDALGRDEWARVVSGAASSLSIAAAATAIALVIGLTVGVAAGASSRRVDGALMRGVDLVLAFPFLLLAILLAALLRDGSLAGSRAPVIVTLGVASWPTIARVVRVKTAVLARGDMVLAARALGASPWRVVARYLVPNVAGTALSLAVLGFAQNLLAEAALSYVGLGPPPPAASWGRMLYEGRLYYRSAPWLVAAPGLALVAAVLAVHALGDGLRRRLDGER